MKKSTALVFALALLFGGGSAAALFSQPKVVFRKGADTWVKIAQANDRQAPFEHPRSVSADELARLLRSLKYFQPSIYALGDKKGEVLPVFEDAELEYLVPPLAQALGQAGPREWVDFCLTAFRGPQFFGSFRQTDGVIFWKDGRMNVVFRAIAVKVEPGQAANSYDPTRGYRAINKITEGDGRTVKAGNWAVIDPQAVLVPTPPTAPAAEPPTAEPPKSAKDRLLELEQLKKDGLVTEEEYQQKRKQILDEL